ncbi:zf-DNL-domain-containing protein [Lophiostoma macrostomum CBS 122681]|uniref:Zf-DNL-domain-containing protein n=1 Tax=Lophiostoma macrostomum CBS 122681 TaxID=1314788 RepID=A0A6A6SSD4_9PLEO|nr:zf-DNL-domain-containing protein [Lophiostoma macrostomum CBS 122681]
MSSPSASFLRCLCRAAAPRIARAPPPQRIPVPKRFYHAPRTSSCLRHRPALRPARITSATARHESTDSVPAKASSDAPETRLDRDQVPAYELTFTCKQCTTRTSHRVSKQGYHHGTVLIECPGCKNRHLISDNLKIFSDKSVTIEDLMREKGQLVKRGSLNAEGDVEFWDDGSTTPRSSNFIPNTSFKAEKDRLTEGPTLPQESENDKS